ncbi:hypothetical protein PHPALM_28143 [Phytophthora palmivora]|uniref:HAT C-terminal dimerisation domain-containing protein n=1 Tax=Phytophthora palmivora TaxID=4796 RepID=A0A2P4XAU1_9STRA|nr:hypothetical protein PHPALM_28143 [Phytophthora palmivora]
MDETVPEYFRCRCGTVRKQTRRNGYTNLVQHVRREHPDFEAVMLAACTAETGSMLNYVRRSAQIVYGWLDWIVKSNLPLHFCENQATRRLTTFVTRCYSNLDPICVETLLRAMEEVTRIVERLIAAEMPARFGVIFDGWGHASEHFIAVFACYEVDGVMKAPLLCMAPLLDTLDEDLSARGYYEFLADMLPRDFGKQITDEDSFVEQLQKRRRLASVAPRYELLGSIPPTSNIAERFFSVVRTTYGQERHSLQPITVEMLLFLRQNEQYWSARTIRRDGKVVGQKLLT